MADDPIEKIAAEIEVFGIPQADGAPPMTTSYLHVRRRQDGAAERAVLGLPAYKGEQGPPGPPGAVHQGERTSAELDALKTVLTKAHVNWAYRNTDTNDQYVWSGETWVIYHQVYATPGPVGPAPTMNPGTLTVAGVTQTGPYGVRVSGSGGSYAIGLDLPQLPKGDKGDPGPAGKIITSTDVSTVKAPAEGDTLVYNAATQKMDWRAAQLGIEEYVVPPANFPTAINIPSTTTRRDLVTLEIPPKSYPYRLDFTGGVDCDSRIGHQIDLEIRRDNPTTGEIVGMGKGQDGEGWREVAFRAHSNVAIDPSNRAGVIEPGTKVVLYVTAIKRYGVLFGWSVRGDNAQLRVRLMRVA